MFKKYEKQQNEKEYFVDIEFMRKYIKSCIKNKPILDNEFHYKILVTDFKMTSILFLGYALAT